MLVGSGLCSLPWFFGWVFLVGMADGNVVSSQVVTISWGEWGWFLVCSVVVWVLRVL